MKGAVNEFNACSTYKNWIWSTTKPNDVIIHFTDIVAAARWYQPQSTTATAMTSCGALQTGGPSLAWKPSSMLGFRKTGTMDNCLISFKNGPFLRSTWFGRAAIEVWYKQTICAKTNTLIEYISIQTGHSWNESKNPTIDLSPVTGLYTTKEQLLLQIVICISYLDSIKAGFLQRLIGLHTGLVKTFTFPAIH